MKIWIQAFRPKTLISSFAPVLTGILLAVHEGYFDFWIATATVACALSLQILTNLANDYFDHKKGADTSERIGPARVTASGLVTHSQIKQAILLNVFISLLLGVYLVIVGGFPILVIGVLSVAFALLYTAGPWPLAYLGLGDFFAFTFFGPIACFGSYYLQSGVLSWNPACVGVLYGSLAVCLLDSNNLRDYEQDKKTNKKTVVVRFGQTFGRYLYCTFLSLSLLWLLVCVLADYLPIWCLPALLTASMVPKMIPMLFRETGRGIIPLLVMTAKFYIIYALLINLGLVIAILV